MRNWKYGISFAEVSPLTAPLPLAGDLYENMEKAATYGYDAVEFHTLPSFHFEWDRIEHMRQQKKGDICMLVTGRLYTQLHYCLISDDPENVKSAVSGLKEYIDQAQKLGVDIVLGWVKGSVPQGGDRDIYMARLANGLSQLNDYARPRNVRIMIEVINHYETNIFNTAQETLDFICTHALDQCYVHLDTYHMGLEEMDPYEAIHLCGKKLGYFHVADNSRRYPGSGQFDFGRLMQALADIGYDGYVTVECLPEPDRDTAAKKAIDYLKICEPKSC